MPFLVILKRFEVWLLLAIVVALIVFAMQPPPPLPGTVLVEPDPSGTENHPPSVSSPDPLAPPEAPATPPKLAIREVRVTPSSPGYIVETLIGGGAGRVSDLVFSEDQVRATTSDGQPVNRFFAPFQETPTLFASGDSVASLRWWLPSPAKSIWIEIDGERIEATLP